jgi:hypothetical protein
MTKYVDRQNTPKERKKTKDTMIQQNKKELEMLEKLQTD